MKKKRTILFYTYYGSRYGTGHLYRDLQLGHALQQSFHIFYSIRGSHQIPKIIPQRSAIVSSNLTEALRKAEPDLLIYDQPYDLGPLQKFSYSKSFPILGLDYFFYNDTRFSAIINLVNKYQKGRIVIPHAYEGLEYAIIRPAIRKIYPQPVKKSVRSILVTFGGADMSNHTSKILEALSLLAGNFSITAILGLLFREKRRVQQLAASSPHSIAIQQGPIEFASLLRRADVVIGGGGATMMEALSLGKPFVTIPQSAEEYDFLRDSELDRCTLFFNRTWGAKKIAPMLQGFCTDYAKRRQYASIGKKRIDRKGIERIIHIIKRIV